MKKLLTITILLGFLIPGVCLANPEAAIFESVLVWQVDGSGDYSLPEVLSNDRYSPSKSVKTKGRIKTITANWKFEGKVTMEVSANNGSSYVPIVNGVPLDSGFTTGSRLKWRANLVEGSKLIEVKISYTDTSGVRGSFGEPALSGFKLRRSVRINNFSPEELFNYQVRISVGLSSEAEGADVHCSGKVKPDFSDVRFTAADGETLLAYYRGDIVDKVANFYVKVPQLPKRGALVYIYYGNAMAEDLSSGEKTFDFFDDFTKGTIDTEKWEVYPELGGSASVKGTQLKVSSAKIISKDYKISDGVIEYQANAAEGFETRFIVKTENDSTTSENLTQLVYSSAYDGAEHCIVVGDIVKVNDIEPISSGKEYNYRVTTKASDIKFERYGKGFREEEASVSLNDASDLTSGYVGMESGKGDVTYYSWLRVRKLADPEPTVDTSRRASEEKVNLSAFTNMEIAGNGDLVLVDVKKGAGYVSKRLLAAFPIRVMVPNWQTTGGELPSVASVDISADNGRHYKMDCAKNAFYYASEEDFVSGSKCRLRVVVPEKASGKASPLQMKSLVIDYAPGSITVISPNGREKWAQGAIKDITWSALEYDPDYPMKLEYSTDSGAAYKEIIVMDNEGSYSWTIPEDMESESVMVRISDDNEPSIYDESDSVFAVGIYTEELEDEVEEEAEEDLFEFLEKEKMNYYAEPYELLIKVNDSYSADPGKDALNYKAGDIVVIKPAGFKWSETEKNSFLILKADMTPDAAGELMRPRRVLTGKTDAKGRPMVRTIGRRKFRIDLEKFDLKPQKGRGKPRLRGHLKEKVDLMKVLKDKEITIDE